MNDADVLAYVKAAAALLGLHLDDDRAHSVALQMGRTQALARLLEGFDLGVEDEICEIFSPKEFPLSVEDRRRGAA